MHMAAVGADRSSEPVRSFGTFTSDLRALADWFAVVALFRHPLGIPLPHTAILPAKQAQLAQGVAKFIGIPADK